MFGAEQELMEPTCLLNPVVPGMEGYIEGRKDNFICHKRVKNAMQGKGR